MDITINLRLLMAFSNFFRELKSNGGINDNSLSLLENLTGDKQLDIILADDDEDDRELFEEAAAYISPRIVVKTACDGRELMKKLNGLDLPDLIFLDLNMPGKNGFECLSEIRKIDRIKNIPVLIYSTSANPDQIENTYKQGANFYIQKPDSYREIIKLLKKIFSFSYHQFFYRSQRKDFVLKL